MLREVFPTEPLPKRPIAPHLCDECAAVRKAFGRLTWDEVPARLIEQHLGALQLFSDEAFRYYAAAWLLRAVETMETELWGGEVAEHLLIALAPEWPLTSKLKKRLGFTRDQKELLRQFLTAYLTLPDPLAIMEARNADIYLE